MKEIKLGTIGSGSIVQAFLEGVGRTEGISLEAVYSRSEEKGRSLASEFGAGKAYTDLEKFFSDGEVNCVYVASPNSLHYAQSKAALLHGKNVICEKPFCTKREQVLELAALAQERRLFLADATPTAFLPNFEALKKLLPRVGRIRLSLCSYSQYSSRYDQLLAGKVTNVFRTDFAGGCLQDINYYNVYLNVALFGKPEAAVYYPNLCSTGADTSGVLILKYPDFVSECSGAKDTWGENFVQIQGEKGYLCIENGSNGLEKLRLVTREGEESCNLQEDPNRWHYEVANLTKMLLADDYEGIYKKLEITADVVGVIEEARKAAGIWFPGD